VISKYLKAVHLFISTKLLRLQGFRKMSFHRMENTRAK